MKRFFKLHDNDDENDLSSTKISSEVHNNQIQAEIVRLVQGKWFLDAFIKHCFRAKVVVDDSEHISSLLYCWLI